MPTIIKKQIQKARQVDSKWGYIKLVPLLFFVAFLFFGWLISGPIFKIFQANQSDGGNSIIPVAHGDDGGGDEGCSDGAGYDGASGSGSGSDSGGAGSGGCGNGAADGGNCGGSTCSSGGSTSCGCWVPPPPPPPPVNCGY